LSYEVLREEEGSSDSSSGGSGRGSGSDSVSNSNNNAPQQPQAEGDLLDLGGLGGALPTPPASSSSSSSSSASSSSSTATATTTTLAAIPMPYRNRNQARNDFRNHNMASLLLGLVTSAPREKVVRIALSALVNLASASPTPSSSNPQGNSSVNEFVTSMLTQGNALKTVQNLKSRQWSDDDVLLDVDTLHTALLKNHGELSTYGKYLGEVTGGKLAWGVTHTEKFWRENNRKLEKNDFEALKLLISLLGSDDDEIVSIACYDIGEFCRFYPNGRGVVKALKGKDIVMGLIEAESEEVRVQALKCISKIMVQKWEFVR